MTIAEGRYLSATRVSDALAARKNFPAGGAKPAFVLLQAGDDLVRDRYEVFAKAIHVRLAGCLLILRARFGHGIRSRETERCRYGHPCRIPHHQIPSRDWLTPRRRIDIQHGACADLI